MLFVSQERLGKASKLGTEGWSDTRGLRQREQKTTVIGSNA